MREKTVGNAPAFPGVSEGRRPVWAHGVCSGADRGVRECLRRGVVAGLPSRLQVAVPSATF